MAKSSARRSLHPRIVIDQVHPSIDCGRFAPKRLVGDDVVVDAVVYKEGHDILAGRLLFRGPGDTRWRGVPMAYTRDLDRLRALLRPDRIGRWSMMVESWTDRFGSWREAVDKRMAAGEDVEIDLMDGAALLDRAAPRGRGGSRKRIEDAAAALRRGDAPLDQRTAGVLTDDFHALILRTLEPDDLTRSAEYPLWVDRERAGVGAWYEFFPRSQSGDPARHGTFRDAETLLPRVSRLGFDVVYLPPIHPVGKVHRKGRNNALVAGPEDPGSPWAIGSDEGGHTAVDPRLGTLDDFDRFVAAATDNGLEVALDYALQCAPDHPWVREHPEWFFRRSDGSLRYAENPPKRYEDIYPLNFWCDDYQALWNACRDIFLFWREHGVRIFRVDNPHTKPFAFWEWVIRELHQHDPGIVLLSEAFTRPARMKGLAKLGFSQSYTYFTWRNNARELAEYFTELTHGGMVEYLRPNLFTNTPDILHEYLQEGGRPAFRIRLLLAATLSPVYGIYSGFELGENVPVRKGSEEYLDSEKYQLRPRDWEAPGNINHDIAELNRLRRAHPALQRFANLEFGSSDNDNLLCYVKTAYGDDLIVVANLDPARVHAGTITVPLSAVGLGAEEAYQVEDLLSGARFEWRGADNEIELDPHREPGRVLRIIRAT